MPWVPFGTGIKIFENIFGDTVQKATFGEFQKILKCLCGTKSWNLCHLHVSVFNLPNCRFVTWNSALPEVDAVKHMVPWFLDTQMIAGCLADNSIMWQK